MGTRYTRQHKINWLLSRIKGAEMKQKALDEEKLIGEFCMIHFSKRETAKDILKSLEGAGRIVRTAGIIVTPEQYEFEKASNSNTSDDHQLNQGEENEN